MVPPLEYVVYVYKQFIQHHYFILSVSLTGEKWQLGGVLTDAANSEGEKEREGWKILSSAWTQMTVITHLTAFVL